MFSKPFASFRLCSSLLSKARGTRGMATQPAVKSSTEQRCPLFYVASGLAFASSAFLVSSPFLLRCDTASTEGAGVDWAALRKDVVALLESEDHMEEPPGPILIRLAWHSSGTFSLCSRTGGSSGATMRFEPESKWGANAGLGKARGMLEPLKEKYPYVSYSDLWVFAACVAVEEMGGPKIPFRPGRKDKSDASLSPPDGRLPNADMGCPYATAQHLRDIFGKMGFDDRDIVALSGAHGLGRCHTESSGYWGPWTRAPTTISNEYFRLLLEETWTPKKTHNGQPWTGPDQFEDPTGELMMLPSDIVLVQDPKFRRWVEYYAKDEQAFLSDFGRAFNKLMELGVEFAE